MKNNVFTAFGLGLVLFVFSCNEPQKKEAEEGSNTKTESQVSPESISSGGNVLKLKDRLFSIPSPVQTAILIRKQEIPFDENLISEFGKVDTYISKNQQALNLGVLGSDLAYLSNYSDIKRSLECLKSVTSISEKLDVQANIDPSLLKRFNENMDNVDSLNILNAEFYRNAERYLKANLQNEASVLILAGGWIESMHFATQNSSNEFLKSRIAEQKSTVSNLNMLLSTFDDKLIKGLSNEFMELEKVYSELAQSYEYKKSITDKETKTTYIKSKSSASLTDSQLNQIKNSISNLRNLITA